MPKRGPLWTRIWRRSAIEKDIDAEMRSHIEHCVDHLMGQGVSREEAERRARAEFGSIDAAKEGARASLGFSWIDGVVRDVRHGIRVHLRSPGWTLSAMLTLALCIGANTAIFTVVDAVLLRPLPYPHPDRLVQIAAVVQSKQGRELELSHDGRTWLAIKDRSAGMDAAIYTSMSSSANLASGNIVETLQQQRVSAGFFGVLGVPMHIGREFSAEEDRVGGPAVAVLSYDLWRRDFSSDPTIVGRQIALRGEPYIVVGVTSPEFRTTVRADVWTPVRPNTNGEGAGQNYEIIGRLRDGVSFAHANSLVRTIGQDLLHDVRFEPGTSIEYQTVGLQRGMTESLRQTLAILWTAVGVVLLIGCINIASLLLARHVRRSREIATRIAVGGGRFAVVRQLLIESLLIGIGGAITGTALGYAGVLALNRIVPDTLNIWQHVGVDARVLTLTVFMSLLASILFGLLPALQATRVDVRSGLSERGGRNVAGVRKHRLGRCLVTAEIALGVMLVIGATLLIRTFDHFMNVRPGFDASNLIVAKFSLQDARYDSAANIRLLMQNGLASIRELPGVESAAAGLCLPYERPLNSGVGVDGRAHFSNVCYATADYFKTLRIPILTGRDFRSGDSVDAEPVIVVNEVFARRYLAGKNPIGTRITLGRPSTIVGVAGSIPFQAGFNNYEPVDSTPAVFIPVNQPPDGFFRSAHTWFNPAWIIRSAGPPEALLPNLLRALQSVDRMLPIAGVYRIEDLQKKTLAPQRFNAVLMGAMAALAVIVAIVGVYGLISNSVVDRAREIGIRLALGATTLGAVRAVASEGIILAVAGTGIGCVLAGLGSQFLRGLVFGLSTTDVFTFYGVAIGAVIVASLASVVPSVRAAAIDPATTLRVD
jgi:predicted permease